MDKIKNIEVSLYEFFDKEEEMKDENSYTYEEEYAMNNFYKHIKRKEMGVIA